MGDKQPDPAIEEKGTVFVIDDDPGLRRALTRLFRTAGRNIEVFSSGREFLERPPYHGIGCVVLDVKMPDMTGPQLHELMASRGIHFPVVFLTGHGDVPTGVGAMKRGAIDFLVKPVDGPLLLRTVEQALSRHAAEHARHSQQQAIRERFSRLTARQREVMGHVIRGRLNKQIAADMRISLQTVKAHRAQIMARMAVRSVAQLVQACELAGIRSLLEAPPGD